MIGTIRNIRDDKDFAFIVSGSDRNIFLHRHNYKGDWDELRKLHTKGVVTVEFETAKGPQGLRAINVKVVE